VTIPILEKKFAVPTGELVHSSKTIISVDNPQGNLQNTPIVSVIPLLAGASLQKFAYEVLSGALGFVFTDIDRIFRLLERVPPVIAPFQDMFLASGRHVVKDRFFAARSLFG
jgi:hypothetical protein